MSNNSCITELVNNETLPNNISDGRNIAIGLFTAKEKKLNKQSTFQ